MIEVSHEIDMPGAIGAPQDAEFKNGNEARSTANEDSTKDVSSLSRTLESTSITAENSVSNTAMSEGNGTSSTFTSPSTHEPGTSQTQKDPSTTIETTTQSTNSSAQHQTPPKSSRKIHFSRSNLTVSYPKNSPLTILQVAESVGLTPEYGCRSGACGTCESKLLAGTVDGPEGDMEDGILICSSTPVFDRKATKDDGVEDGVARGNERDGGWGWGYGNLVGRRGREFERRGFERGTVVVDL